MSEITTWKTETPEVNRQPLWLLAAPVAVIGILILVLVLLLIVPGSPLRLAEAAQVSIIGNIMLMAIILCPLVICFTPIALLLMVSVFGMFRIQQKTADGLKAASVTTHSLADRTARTADSLSRQSIGFSARFAFFNRLFNIFERPKSTGQIEGRTIDERE